ncbi:MAG: 30S ribosomal protein S21 [Planctomycetales bacterium]|nr:30S ribosomal protein S21 [Planctomycetales bacterium]
MRRVVVEECESLRAAIRQLSKLCFECGVGPHPAYRRRTIPRGWYVSYSGQKHQRFYFEKPGVKRRRARSRAKQNHRRASASCNLS